METETKVAYLDLCQRFVADESGKVLINFLKWGAGIQNPNPPQGEIQKLQGFLNEAREQGRTPTITRPDKHESTTTVMWQDPNTGRHRTEKLNLNDAFWTRYNQEQASKK